MDSAHWNNFRRGVATVLVDVSEGEKRLPKNWPIPQNTLDLYLYLKGLFFNWRLDALALLTEDTLKKAAQTLANAHKVAANVKVDKPDEAVIKSTLDHLKKITAVLKREERFRVAFQFAQAIVDIYGRFKREA